VPGDPETRPDPAVRTGAGPAGSGRAEGRRAEGGEDCAASEGAFGGFRGRGPGLAGTVPRDGSGGAPRGFPGRQGPEDPARDPPGGRPSGRRDDPPSESPDRLPADSPDAGFDDGLEEGFDDGPDDCPDDDTDAGFDDGHDAGFDDGPDGPPPGQSPSGAPGGPSAGQAGRPDPAGGRGAASLPPGLHLLPGPLGNLGDLSPRAASVLAGADLVAAEDTRRTVKLLNHLGLKKRLLSYREQNHDRAWPAIRSVLGRGGRVALLSDAGAPTVPDPGAQLVAAARAAGFRVSPVPGPSAVITALMASGLPSTPFTFAGFLPPRQAARRAAIESLKPLPGLLVLFESPVRLAASLADLASILGPRPALLAREMTKIHEEYLALDLDAMAAEVGARPRRGEVTLVIGPGPAGPPPGPPDPEDLAERIARDPRPTRAVADSLAAELSLPRKRIYDLVVSVRERLRDRDGGD
jgi:16S rRNA (cytidine1402-2'-O)-methyltransferase